MTFYVENETDAVPAFDVDTVIQLVAQETLDMEGCPYEAQVNILLTDNGGIQVYNKEYREIDRPTDVLSFPNIDFMSPSDFSQVENEPADYFEPDTGELILGDIIVSLDKVREQALEFGHSEKREFAFLIAHSMLHLCGYDHEEKTEAKVMEEKQKRVLDSLGITREASL